MSDEDLGKLTDRQARVVQERQSLDAKIGLLARFIQTSTFAGLPEAEQERMKRQFRHMLDYSAVLGERIAAFVIA